MGLLRVLFRIIRVVRPKSGNNATMPNDHSKRTETTRRNIRSDAKWKNRFLARAAAILSFITPVKCPEFETESAIPTVRAENYSSPCPSPYSRVRSLSQSQRRFLGCCCRGRYSEKAIVLWRACGEASTSHACLGAALASACAQPFLGPRLSSNGSSVFVRRTEHSRTHFSALSFTHFSPSQARALALCIRHHTPDQQQ